MRHREEWVVVVAVLLGGGDGVGGRFDGGHKEPPGQDAWLSSQSHPGSSRHSGHARVIVSLGIILQVPGFLVNNAGAFLRFLLNIWEVKEERRVSMS